jgi:hypothetical protein
MDSAGRAGMAHHWQSKGAAVPVWSQLLLLVLKTHWQMDVLCDHCSALFFQAYCYFMLGPPVCVQAFVFRVFLLVLFFVSLLKSCKFYCHVSY